MTASGAVGRPGNQSVYCTYFDHRYLARGLAMFHSLRRHQPYAEMCVLCLSAECHDALSAMNLPGLTLISLREFEDSNADLKAVKPGRGLLDYYFTCTPALPRYVLDRCPSADIVVYVDADLYFFGDPSAILESFEGHSIGVTSHHFATRYTLDGMTLQEAYGRYNVAFLTFRRSEEASACLRWWREQCLEWCANRHEDGKFADQHYLDEWPHRFPSFVEFSHKGANLAPWNVAGHGLQVSGGRVLVDGEPLIFFHFSGFSWINDYVSGLGLLKHTAPTRFLRRHIYRPYIEAYADALQEQRRYLKSSPNGAGKLQSAATLTSRRHQLGRIAAGVVRGEYAVRFRGILQSPYVSLGVQTSQRVS